MDIINLLGLVLNLIGTLLITFSGGSIIMQINTALTAHQLTLETFLDPARPNVPLFTGLEKNRDSQLRRTKCLLTFGLVLILLGFVLQAFAAAAPLFK